MSRTWNGESLVNELSALLGDTSTVFKTRILGWLNDVIFEVNARHDWGHYYVKGKKILAQGEEIQSLEIEAPTAPTVSLAADGNLVVNSVYSFLVTYVQDNGVETVAGEASEALTATESQRTILLEDIPTTAESLVTKRNVYVKVDDDPFYFHTQIDDNYSTTLEIDTDPDSTIEPPDYGAIRRLDGGPFFEESPSNYLKFKPMAQLRLLIQGQWSEGSPEYFSPLSENSISVYPLPSSDLEVSFNYYRNPFKLYNDADSQPDLPISFKPLIKAGVIALGYEYRDRQGQEGKRAIYENMIIDSINRMGLVANVEYAVRDVYGNPDGFEVG